MKKHLTKRILALLLTLVMVLSLLPTAFAAAPRDHSGVNASDPEYYLVGSMSSWSAQTEYKLSASETNPGEFVLKGIALEANTEVKVKDEPNNVWYPDGMGNNCLVNDAGTYDLSFFPAGGKEEEGYYYGFFKLEKQAEPVNTEFEFLVTSDLHGQIFATDYTQPYEKSGTYSRGLTRVSSYIKEQKQIYGDNLYVVDMGDTFQGAPLTYYYAFNKPDVKDPAIRAFRTIGYDMWVVGNHEFNYGLNILTRQMDYAVSPGDENEKQLTISMANYLKAETNNGESKDWATWRDVAPYVIKDFGGYKVAVIGFGNPNVPKWDVPANWEGIYFAPIVETYKHYEAEMLEQADMIVVVAHSGTDSDPGSDFMKQLVEETDTIAFAFSGHEHKNTITEVTNAAGKVIPILSPYTKARRIAQVKVTVNGDEITVTPELKNMENYTLDEELATLLQPYETDTWENYMLQPIGKALGDYPAANLGTAPSAFMDLINTVQAWGAYDNTGLNTPDKAEDDVPPMLSISAPLTSGDKENLIAEGDIFLGDMFGLYRFENWFYQITMSGEEVHQWLEFAATKIKVDDEGKPYVTNGDLTYYDVIMGDGFHYEIDVSKPEGERVVKMTWNGADVAADQQFTVVVNNYRYNGGGNYVKWLNEHGCEFTANDPDRIIYSTQYDMLQGEDEGQARALLVSYIKKETAANGGITPFISSDWVVRNGEEAPEEELAGKTIILHTNDTHGALRGFAQVAKVKADLEARGAKVILVDAGDYSQGNTYVSTSNGATAIELMNAAGYDVATLGNHEFDFGYAQLMRNFETAEFMPICADVYNKETGDPILPAYFIKEVDGVKIGFFGMETPETQTKVNPGLIKEIEFGTNENGKFLSGAQHAIAALKIEGADLIIGLVHLGVDDESEPYRSVDLYNEIKDDVDFLIDGHSHTVMTEGPNGEPIQSTGTKASDTALMNVGCIVIDNATKKIEENKLIPLGEDAPVDEEVAAVAREIMEAVDAEYGAKFAESKVDLNGDKAPGNRNMETNLGDLITDALRWSVMKDMDAETLGVPEENVVAITNGGGIRAWIKKGDVTKNDVNTVLPFGNTVAVVYVTGAELLEALEASTYCTPTAVGGFPQVSGMNITIDTKKSYDQGELYTGSTYHGPASIRRVTIDDVNGKDFDPEATYAVITNNFCAAGGDTYYAFAAASEQFDTGIPMDEALMDFILDPNFLNGVISEHYAEPQGRITIKNGFDDVQDPSKYYYTPVYWAYDHEPQITGGKTDTLFGVKDPCTREQIVTFLWKAYGAEQPTNTDNPFTEDVKEGKYYFKAVMWAKEKGITGGVTNTKFGVGKPCTREQAVTFLWKAAGAPEPKLTENPFEDVVPGKYYYKAVLWAFENGVTGGVSETKFGVGKTCTRAQIVTFLYAAIAKEHEASIKVFETTDVHGYLLDASSLVEESFQYRLAYLSNLFNEARESEDYDDVLLLDGGDIYQGTPVSNLLQGNAIRAALDKMGYDAVALGNHEFDWGVTNNADEQGTIPAYEIGEFSGDPDIPILAYNLYYADSGEPVNFTQDYTVVEKAGYRIAIIGYIPNYRGDIMAARINPYTIDEDLTKLAAKVKEVNEAEKPDVTIVLAHDSPKGVANAMDPADVDMVIGGHSHSGNAGVADNGIAYIQGNCQAKGYASANIVITKKGAGEPVVEVTEPLYTSTTGKDNIPNLYDTEENADKLDPVIVEISHLAWEAVKGDMEEVLGYVNVSVDKTKVSDNGATVAGNWISGLMLRGTADLEPVAAFYNSGGIRTTFKIPEGETTRNITTADIYTINPFDNCWLVYELNGPEIAQQLLNGFINGNFGDQMSGLTFTYWQEGSGKDAVRGIVSVTLSDGTEIDLNDTETTYRVCTSNYSATLDGSVFHDKEPLVPIADAPIDNVTIIELLRAEGKANDGYLAVDTGVRGTKVEKPVEAAYYLVGSMSDWTAQDAYKLEEAEDGEYVLKGVELAAGAEVKVKDEISNTWYPDGMGNNFVVNEAGTYNLSFYPAGGREDYYCGFFKLTKLSDDIVVLYTNDVHCGVDQDEASIGVAGLAKVKKELETDHANVVLVDNGDFIQGELIGTVSKGEYLVQLMNYLGYDYAAFGNHEFDYTIPRLKTLVDLAEAQYLSCNFKYIGNEGGADAIDLPSYEIVDYGGLKVAFVGITTPESLTKSTPTYFQDENGEWIYSFCSGGNGQELYSAVQTAVDAARAEGAQVVVCLAHLGIDEQSSPWMSTEVIANTTGIDVMLDGHSHSTIERTEVIDKEGKTVLLSSTGTKLANIGKLTITKDGAVNTELIKRADVDGVDPDAQAYLEQIEAEFEALKQQVVAHVDYPLLTTHPETKQRMIRVRETNLGDACADAYRKILGADIAFVNGGGIRADIAAGDVSYEQIIKVHPYGNMACLVKATGQQILDALEMSVRNSELDENGEIIAEGHENGGFLQVAGLKFVVNTAIASTVELDENKMFAGVSGARRVQDVQILQADGSYLPIDPAGEYTLASHNYMLKQCGDGINMFKNDEILLDEVKVDNQVLIEYMTSEDFAAHDYSNWEGEGRITFINEAPPEELRGYVPADSVADGDQILYVVEYNGAHYAMSNDTSVSNALGAETIPEVTFKEDGTLDGVPVDAVWRLEAGSSDGTFLLKDGEGKYISYNSGTAVKLADEGTEFKITCGNGTAAIKPASSDNRQIFLRDNDPVQFRCYSTQNLTASGYSAVLTIYKFVP